MQLVCVGSEAVPLAALADLARSAQWRLVVPAVWQTWMVWEGGTQQPMIAPLLYCYVAVLLW